VRIGGQRLLERLTQDNYLGRRLTSRRTAEALQVAAGIAFTDR
jgi:hypothetical protein